MDAPRHIGFVTTSFPKFKGDTAGSFVFGMARAFRDRGISIDVVVPEPSEETDWEPGEPWLKGIRVIKTRYAYPRSRETLFFGSGVPDNLRQNPFNALLIPPAVLQLVLKTAYAAKNWDAVISHWLAPSAFVTAAALRIALKKKAVGSPIPHLAVAHSGDVHLLSSPMLRPLALAVGKSASSVGFISENLRNKYFNIIGPKAAEKILSKTCITPMGIDQNELITNKSREELRHFFGFKKFTVLFLGRLVPIKGADILIDALECLDECEIVVAGEGPERQSLELRAKNKNVSAEFLGAVNAETRADLFKACDVLVLPSITTKSKRTEGMPLVIIEAAAANIPVIASDTGSVSEFITHKKNGLLFKERDISALTALILELKNNSKLRETLTQNAFENAKTRHWPNLIEQILEENTIFVF